MKFDPLDGRLQSGIRGLAPHDGAFRQGSFTETSSKLRLVLEPLDLRSPVRVARHSQVPQGTLDQISRSAQRRLLNDFIPSLERTPLGLPVCTGANTIRLAGLHGFTVHGVAQF